MATKFVAEICSNHNGDLGRAVALIDEAARIGCDSVKFQLFRIDKLFHESVLSHPDYQFIHDRREWELPLDWLPVLLEECHERGMEFSCTPFYVSAVDELYQYVDFYKIASYSLLHTDLLAATAATGKPVVLSTGMATLKEVNQAVRVLAQNGCGNLTLLHCVSTYPTPVDQINIGFFNELIRLSINSPGWSDHSVNPAVIYLFALKYSASMIEFHLDLDGHGDEYSIGHCWLPGQIKLVIEAVRMIESTEPATGNEFSDSEQVERLWRADPADGLRPLVEKRKELS